MYEIKTKPQLGASVEAFLDQIEDSQLQNDSRAVH